ncbi:ArsR family transcriptional regulator [Agrobacterium tumefaciens]|jgi:ArsR family transcriptional regulator|uniref:ArsR family transcriptional regulator n=4 Tax=Rhizobium/Agrobacterium group TaxID=227290 RepID=A0AAW8LRQ9_AGRTU|nr:AraC family transcriptional regulator [Agrobacterium tumefaciens]MBB4406446.1 ArsR family transcriptional regulator [Agrobacterium radiobacter]CUX12111.1 ArsR family transcriptional regulator [Agrobacterium tumefaciens str. Kerr 14]CVI16902.1 ArsR family transcriptional regulator [Agrobacterium tumefaciens str. B6]AYM81689.1 AraC family transcriptional regulator [Agrobacterium tumefaciens]
MSDIKETQMNPEEILKALSHPARLKFLEWLKRPESHFCQEHPLSMGVCANQFQISGLSQSTVSSHLAVLQTAGLIRSKKVGQWVFFERNEETIDAFRNYLQANL